MYTNSRKLFKKFLATSAVACISSLSPEAMAVSVPKISMLSVSDLGNPAHWLPGNFNSGDSIVYGGNHTIIANGLPAPFDINVVSSANNPIVGNINISNTTLRFGSISSLLSGGGVGIVLDTGGNAVLASMEGDTDHLDIGPNDYRKFQGFDFGGVAGSSLTITNSVLVSLATNFTSTGGDAGTIVVDNNTYVIFSGNFSSAAGSQVENLVIKDGSVVEIFNTSLNLSNSIDLDQGGTIVLDENTQVSTPGGIRHSNPLSQRGQVIFQGNADVNTTLGSFQYNLKSISIGAGETRLNENFLYSKDTIFTENSVLRLNGGGINNFVVIGGQFKPLNDGQGKWRIAKDTLLTSNFSSEFGEAGLRFENINFQNDSNLILMLDSPYVQTITTSNDGQGSLFLISDSPMFLDSDIGSAGLRLKNISYQPINPIAELTLKNGHSIYAEEIPLYYRWDTTIDYGGDITGPLSTTPIIGSSKLILEDNVLLDARITTINDKVITSEVDVLGNATILQDIGTATDRMTTIKFMGSSGSTVNLSGDLHGNNITLAEPNIVLGDNLLFDGMVVSDSTTYRLGNNTLTFDNDTASPSVFSGTPSVNFTVDDNKFGHLVIVDGELNMNGDTTIDSLNLSLTDLAATLPPVGSTGQSYPIFSATGTGSITVTDNSKVNFTIVKQNPFVKWSYTNGIATRVRLPQDVIDKTVTDIVKNSGGSNTAAQNAALILNPNNTGDAAALAGNLASLIINDGDLVQALNDLSIIESSEQISEAIDQSFSGLDNRITAIRVPTLLASNDSEIVGMAAGDDMYKYGAWASGFYNEATQGMRGTHPGFKSRTTGFLVGADTLVTDATTVGLAVSFAHNKVKHKGGNKGETTGVKAYTVSFYGLKEINDQWFLQGAALLSHSKIENRELRRFSGREEIARSNFKVASYGISTKLGYNTLLTDEVLMTLLGGAEYLTLNPSKYQESGTTNQNLLVRKRRDQKLDAIADVSVAYSTKMNDYKIIPQIHGSLSYDILNKSPRVTVSLAGLFGDRLVNTTAEQTRLFYNAGTSLTVSKGPTEFSAVYDYYFGKKYSAHQGMLKVRLNFR